MWSAANTYVSKSNRLEEGLATVNDFLLIDLVLEYENLRRVMLSVRSEISFGKGHCIGYSKKFVGGR